MDSKIREEIVAEFVSLELRVSAVRKVRIDHEDYGYAPNVEEKFLEVEFLSKGKKKRRCTLSELDVILHEDSSKSLLCCVESDPKTWAEIASFWFDLGNIIYPSVRFVPFASKGFILEQLAPRFDSDGLTFHVLEFSEQLHDYYPRKVVWNPVTSSVNSEPST